MKIRWNETSVRLRITPAELAALEGGESVAEHLALPGGWAAAIVPGSAVTQLVNTPDGLRIDLCESDLQALLETAREGVYFVQAPPASIRFYIEKDFPCIHPRAAESLEPLTPTFDPPPGFAERKSATP